MKFLENRVELAFFDADPAVAHFDAQIVAAVATGDHDAALAGVLDRIPDYEVDHSGVQQYMGNPAMTGLGTLPVTFSPAESRKTPRPW